MNKIENIVKNILFTMVCSSGKHHISLPCPEVLIALPYCLS